MKGEEENVFNDMYTLSFTIDESEKKFIAEWKPERIDGIKPQPRYFVHKCI